MAVRVNFAAVRQQHLSKSRSDGKSDIKRRGFHAPQARRVKNHAFTPLDPNLMQQGNIRSSRRIQLNAKCSAGDAASTSRPASQPRLIQNKEEAFWFYRFLSIVYDHVVNPGHWTEDMREDALEPANISAEHKIYDVGAGTGFTTLGVIQAGGKPENITMLDQSPHQLAKAEGKEALKSVKKIQGDAENLPFETDSADRYTSAGSIEYWPNPQRGISEAYRVIKPGGLACLIGPVYPTFWLSRWMADLWMLFPTEQEYIDWFTNAGFTDVKLKRIGPSWYRGVRRHGLIMGCSVTGVKAEAGPGPLYAEPSDQEQQVQGPKSNPLSFLIRMILGCIGGFYYTLVPIYMWIKNLIFPKSWEI